MNDKVRDALADAATSLETISRLSGRETYGNPPVESLMGTFEEVRAYAASRATTARAALASPPQEQASEWKLPPEIALIIEHLHTQDNRITDNPLFAVQQKLRVYGLDPDYRDGVEYVDYDGDRCEKDESAREVGFRDCWEFVTGCFTEAGCKDYITRNGHNLHEPRIYAYGSYRNTEFIALRKWLMSLAAPSQEQAKGRV